MLGRASSAASLTRWASPPESVGAGWPEREVVEADVGERLQDPANLRDVAEQLERLADAHGQHVGDRLALVLDGERLGVVAAAVADVALDPDVGQEVHLDLLLAHSLARLAAAAGLVEAEPPRVVAADLRLGQLGEELADQVEDAGVGRRVGRRRVAERVLIDVDDLVDVLEAANVVVRRRRRCGPGAACGRACCRAPR